MRRCETAGFHRGVSGSRHTFHPVPSGTDKLGLLLQVPFSGHFHGNPDAWAATDYGPNSPSEV